MPDALWIELLAADGFENVGATILGTQTVRIRSPAVSPAFQVKLDGFRADTHVVSLTRRTGLGDANAEASSVRPSRPTTMAPVSSGEV